MYKIGFVPSRESIPYDVADLTRVVDYLQTQVRYLTLLLNKVGSDKYTYAWDEIRKEYKELSEL